MKAIATPIQECFSSDNMEGAYYHEYNEGNKNPHTVHKYDKDGNYIIGSTKSIDEISKEDIFYVSDRFGNKLEKNKGKKCKLS